MQATGVVEGQQARPLFRLPDLLTAFRIPLAGAFVLADGTVLRIAIVALAAVSDLLDGFWARRIGGSRAGVVLDPVCDKLFMTAAFIVVWRVGPLTLLEVVGVVLRDLVAAFAFIATWALRRPTVLPARAGGKAVTVCQLLTLVAFVTGSEYVRPLAWATAAVSLYAIADYTRVAWRR